MPFILCSVFFKKDFIYVSYVDILHFLMHFLDFISLFFKDCIYLLLDREEGRGKERERNIEVWLHLHTPYWGPGL